MLQCKVHRRKFTLNFDPTFTILNIWFPCEISTAYNLETALRDVRLVYKMQATHYEIQYNKIRKSCSSLSIKSLVFYSKVVTFKYVSSKKYAVGTNTHTPQNISQNKSHPRNSRFSKVNEASLATQKLRISKEHFTLRVPPSLSLSLFSYTRTHAPEHQRVPGRKSSRPRQLARWAPSLPSPRDARYANSIRAPA